MDALSLRNYRDYFVDSLRKELCALECKNMHTKCEKLSKVYCCIFHQSRLKNAYKHLSDESLMHFHTSVASSLRKSIYMSCVLGTALYFSVRGAAKK